MHILDVFKFFLCVCYCETLPLRVFAGALIPVDNIVCIQHGETNVANRVAANLFYSSLFF